MRIAVIGLGYIGLPTALIMSANNLSVIGVDIDESIINRLNTGEVTFEEEGLKELYSKAVHHGISFQSAIPEANFYIIAVPTPYNPSTKRIDTSIVTTAVKSVVEVAPLNSTVIIESTISPGVIDRDIRPIIESLGRRTGEDIHLAHAPERIIPGNMLFELMHNSRTIGVDNDDIGNEIKKIYSTFCKGDIIITDIRTAELSKVVENTFRDINIAFANELSRICNEAKVDVYEVISIANKHPRVDILTPGPGVGGHCIPVDPWFLVGDFPDKSLLIQQARNINDSQPTYIWNRALEVFLKHGIKNSDKIGLYGLTYKENVDDTRESPTLQLLGQLNPIERARIVVYDPFVKREVHPSQVFSLQEFLDSVDYLLIMVAHDEIKDQKDLLSNKVIFDTKMLFGNVSELHNYYHL